LKAIPLSKKKKKIEKIPPEKVKREDSNLWNIITKRERRIEIPREVIETLLRSLSSSLILHHPVNF